MSGPGPGTGRLIRGLLNQARPESKVGHSESESARAAATGTVTGRIIISGWDHIQGPQPQAQAEGGLATVTLVRVAIIIE